MLGSCSTSVFSRLFTNQDEMFIVCMLTSSSRIVICSSHTHSCLEASFTGFREYSPLTLINNTFELFSAYLLLRPDESRGPGWLHERELRWLELPYRRRRPCLSLTFWGLRPRYSTVWRADSAAAQKLRRARKTDWDSTVAVETLSQSDFTSNFTSSEKVCLLFRKTSPVQCVPTKFFWIKIWN